LLLYLTFYVLSCEASRLPALCNTQVNVEWPYNKRPHDRELDEVSDRS